ncbi:metabotropic glutamate receptor 2-like [Sycon ciliatum]|uniref:metabotropic glutamate receptor 2-like n=1 Tax=Sycon ciliatum TaxID=27933 RepID=UPI0031F611A9
MDGVQYDRSSRLQLSVSLHHVLVILLLHGCVLVSNMTLGQSSSISPAAASITQGAITSVQSTLATNTRSPAAGGNSPTARNPASQSPGQAPQTSWASGGAQSQTPPSRNSPPAGGSSGTGPSGQSGQPGSGHNPACNSRRRLPTVFQEPDVCHYDEPATLGGALLGAMFDLHSTFSNVAYTCPTRTFQNWSAVMQTHAFLVAKDDMVQLLAAANPSVDRELSVQYNTTLADALGVRIRDTCSSSLLGTVNVIHLTVGALEETSDDGSCEPRVQLLVGPASSTEVASVSQILSSKSIPQITYWASSSVFDDTDEYPYLFRTVPSDKHQVRGLADMIEHFGWRYVAVVASSDTLYGQSGLEGLRAEADSRLTFCIAEEFTISRSYSSHSNAAVRALRRDTQVRVIVLYAVLDDARSFILSMLRQNYTDVVVIGSEDWVNRLDFNDLLDAGSVLNGTRAFPTILGLAPRPVQTTLLESETRRLGDMFRDPQAMARYWPRNPWLRQYLESTLHCSLPDNDAPACQNSTYARMCRPDEVYFQYVPSLLPTQPLMQAVFLGTTAMFYSVNITASRINAKSPLPGQPVQPSCAQLGGADIRCHLSEMTIPCDDVAHLIPDEYKASTRGTFYADTDVRELCHMFTEDQSALPLYWVMNLHLTASGDFGMERIGSWQDAWSESSLAERLTLNETSGIAWSLSGKLAHVHDNTSYPRSVCHTDCQPGYRRSLVETVLHCCWECQKCRQDAISTELNSDSCRECSELTAPNEQQTECVDIPSTYIKLTDSYGIIILVEASAGILVVLFTLIMLWTNRSNQITKACDLHLSTVILCSGVLAFVSAIAAMLRPTHSQCTRTLLFSTPWTLLCSATVLAKTNRLQRLFNADAFSRLKLLSTPYQLVFIVGLALIGEAIAVAAVFISKPDAERVLISDGVVHLLCQGSKITQWYGSIVAYNILLILICLVVATRVRKLPKSFNEARLIFMASFCTFMVWLGLGPAFFITEGILQPFIIALSSSTQIWSLWACLFGPRLYQLLSPKAKAKQLRRNTTGSSSATFEHSQRRARKEHDKQQSYRHGKSSMGSIGRSATISSEISYSTDDYPVSASPKISTASMSSTTGLLLQSPMNGIQLSPLMGTSEDCSIAESDTVVSETTTTMYCITPSPNPSRASTNMANELQSSDGGDMEQFSNGGTGYAGHCQ